MGKFFSIYIRNFHNKFAVVHCKYIFPSKDAYVLIFGTSNIIILSDKWSFACRSKVLIWRMGKCDYSGECDRLS